MNLTLLTWNVSEVANVTSDKAPWRFTAQDKVQRIAAAIQQHSPDIVALQEASVSANQQNLASTLHSTHDYYPLGTAHSHCGHVCLLIKHRLFQKAQLLQAEGPHVVARLTPAASQTAAAAAAAPAAPAAAAQSAAAQSAAAGPDHSTVGAGNAGSKAVYVACCHLAPFKEGAELRAAQLELITRSITNTDPDACMVVAGDMNMREIETHSALELGLEDAWLLSGSHPSAQFTWNSKVNQYLADCFGFTCRFDRVFVSPGVQVHGFSLVGDQPVEGQPGHYLSDHFGIVTQLQLPV